MIISDIIMIWFLVFKKEGRTMDNLFKLKEHNTDVKTEISSGVTTFLAMVYILAVNPSILSASGMDAQSIFTATCVSAALGCFMMAFLANYPVALASGMGLNAYFAYTVCGQLSEAGVSEPYKVALVAVLAEGIIFVLLSFTNFREKLVNEVPANIKYGITAGIGLFIASIGFKNAGIIVGSDSTVVALGDLATPQVTLALVGILIIAALTHYKVRGAVLLGILATWILGMIAEVTGWYAVDPEAGVYSVFPSFDLSNFAPVDKHIFAFDFEWIGGHVVEFIAVIFSFLFVDIYDTVGTLIGVADKGGLLDKEGHLPNAKGALLADAIATIGGACLGASTVTSYVESSAGVANGGRTGLTAATTGVLFLASLVLSPIFLAIPSFATTPALVFVGYLMIMSIKNIDFDSDIADAIGAFMAIIMMPFTASIAEGIMFGMLSWVILKIVTGKVKDISLVMWISAVLFSLYILQLAHPLF